MRIDRQALESHCDPEVQYPGVFSLSVPEDTCRLHIPDKIAPCNDLDIGFRHQAVGVHLGGES